MQSARDVRAYLIDTALPTLFPAPVLVTHSTPSNNLPDDIVSVGAQRFDMSKPTMGTNRSREEVVETDIVFSAYVPGDEDGQRLATSRAFDMALAFDEWLRLGDNAKLSGTGGVIDAWTTSGELEESKVVPPKDSGGTGVTGRLATLVVTLTTKARR